jgi:predicted DCC family thiol-disulfide oxidoreductase YuxK
VNDIVIFDGVCNFCARSVNFILRHEARPDIRFSPLQSAAGTRLLREFNFDPADTKTFVLISNGTAFVKSDAAIRVTRNFSGAWRYLSLLKFVPRPIRDFAYDAIARNRYRWFGRNETCMVPTPELAARFLLE